MGDVPGYLGRVLDLGGSPLGTCFQVHPRILVTAWHVLVTAGAARPGGRVRVDGLPLGGAKPDQAEVLVVDELHDLAVMRRDTPLPESVRGLAATNAVALYAPVVVTGHVVVDDPEVSPPRHLDASGRWAGGTTREDSVSVGRMKADDTLRGMSGAPVRRQSDDAVVGVVSARYHSVDGWLRDSVWVARTEDLLLLLMQVAETTRIALGPTTTRLHVDGQAVQSQRGATNTVESDSADTPSLYGTGNAVPSSYLWRAPTRNRHFVGRESVLALLHRALHDDDRPPPGVVAVVSLQGLGGIGKTQISLEYLYRNSDNYRISWWVDAETSNLIVDSLLALAEELSISGATPSRVVEKLWHALSLRRDWLLIYDNVSDLNQLGGLHPPATGKWIITSRNPAVSRIAPTIEIGEFEREESLSLLSSRVPSLPREQADELAEALGDLPLAVEQAGYFLDETGFDISDYLRLLQESPRDAGLNDATIGDHPGLVTVIDTSVQILQHRDPLTASALHVLGLMAPESVPILPLESGPPQGRSFGIRLGNRADTARLVRALAASGLVKREARSLKMHRLVRLLLVSRLSRSELRELQWRALERLIESNPGDGFIPTNWPNYAALFPHVQSLAERGPAFNGWAKVEPYTGLVLDCVGYAYRAGRYDIGLKLSVTCLGQWESMLGRMHPSTLRLKNNLGMCLTGQRKFDEATVLYRKLSKQYEDLFGPDSEFTIRATNNIGVTLNGSRNYEAARDVLLHALSGWRGTRGDQDVETLRTADNLTEALLGLGSITEATDLALETLALRRGLFSDDHPETLNTRHNLGVALSYTDRAAAVRLLRETLNARAETLGQEHPDTIATRQSLDEVERSS